MTKGKPVEYKIMKVRMEGLISVPFIFWPHQTWTECYAIRDAQLLVLGHQLEMEDDP